MKEIELKGGAVMEDGVWYANKSRHSPLISNHRDFILVDGSWRGLRMTPDTARSMASALLHFADKAEAWSEAK